MPQGFIFCISSFTFEYFRKGEQLLANEVAPRVHNSGHWSIEGADVSQFENHIRAIAGLPLGNTHSSKNVALFNIIGKACDEVRLLKVDGAHLHMYHKVEKPGRKIGHITFVQEDDVLFAKGLKDIEALLKNDLG